MVKQFWNWRILLAIIGILIIAGTIIYTNILSKKIAAQERKKVEQWVEAKKLEILTEEEKTLNFVTAITTTNTEIPIIYTTNNDSIIDAVNLDTIKIKKNKNYLTSQLASFKSLNQPIIWINPLDSTQQDKLYYGPSVLSTQLKWYPIIQLIIVGLFILITLITLHTRNKSAQNQVWAGMAKETAHQLGTPLNSLIGWVEYLKSTDVPPSTITEIEKDVERISLVSDRFGKIGSQPQPTAQNMVLLIQNMVDYMRKRASGKTNFIFQPETDEVNANVSPQLFDWVLENLIKNALDAMEGVGTLTIKLINKPTDVVIEVADTGKGIHRSQWKKIFKPGFTTKKRGWGLGLSLTKRIVEEYHGGKIAVKWSEMNKGTCFVIQLPKV
jgi:signal transduction histidine kinase